MANEQQQLTPSEQTEAVTITVPTADPVERNREEPEREVIKPVPLPEPIITTPPPKESKPPSPAPPMIGRVNTGQGGIGNGAAYLAPAGLPLSDSPPPPPQAVRKSTGVVRGRVLTRVDPTNPTSALSRLTGTVVVEVQIDERGNVTSARALSGNPVLQTSALSAAKRWKFEPSKLNGTAVQATGQITFNFK
jgi:protein TonB